MNPINRRTAGRALLAAGALAAVGGAARAQAWPSRPIRLVVPFATGGGSDFIGRFMAQRLGQALGQPVVVENRPGAGSTLGIELVVKSPPDGHTFGLIASSYTVTPSLYRLRFDPVTDITPVIQFSQGPMLVVVPKSLPVANFTELVALARSRPGALNYASAGQGSITHLACALFADMAGLQMTHIPYKGTGPALTDTMAGQTQLFFSSTATALPHVQSGALRALAVTTRERLGTLAAIPTIAESGLPAYDVPLWHGMIGPAGVSSEIVARLVSESRRTLSLRETAEQLAQDGVAPAPEGSPAQFRDRIRSEIDQWRGVVARAGVRIE
ncbi:MAG: tripartite tricarboxylate transporter substrate binding protein [Betaproteobacteria bacterium]|nr:tripartite tricarboxylate transporter substrate binding protein [Betaproteobacteria bacterium]